MGRGGKRRAGSVGSGESKKRSRNHSKKKQQEQQQQRQWQRKQHKPQQPSHWRHQPSRGETCVGNSSEPTPAAAAQTPPSPMPFKRNKPMMPSPHHRKHTQHQKNQRQRQRQPPRDTTQQEQPTPMAAAGRGGRKRQRRRRNRPGHSTTNHQHHQGDRTSTQTPSLTSSFLASSSSSSSSASDLVVKSDSGPFGQLPGHYYDPEKKKYFKLQPGQKPPVFVDKEAQAKREEEAALKRAQELQRRKARTSVRQGYCASQNLACVRFAWRSNRLHLRRALSSARGTGITLPPKQALLLSSSSAAASSSSSSSSASGCSPAITPIHGNRYPALVRKLLLSETGLQHHVAKVYLGFPCASIGSLCRWKGNPTISLLSARSEMASLPHPSVFFPHPLPVDVPAALRAATPSLHRQATTTTTTTTTTRSTRHTSHGRAERVAHARHDRRSANSSSSSNNTTNADADSIAGGRRLEVSARVHPASGRRLRQPSSFSSTALSLPGARVPAACITRPTILPAMPMSAGANAARSEGRASPGTEHNVTDNTTQMATTAGATAATAPSSNSTTAATAATASHVPFLPVASHETPPFIPEARCLHGPVHCGEGSHVLFESGMEFYVVGPDNVHVKLPIASRLSCMCGPTLLSVFQEGDVFACVVACERTACLFRTRLSTETHTHGRQQRWQLQQRQQQPGAASSQGSRCTSGSMGHGGPLLQMVTRPGRSDFTACSVGRCGREAWLGQRDGSLWLLTCDGDLIRKGKFRSSVASLQALDRGDKLLVQALGDCLAVLQPNHTTTTTTTTTTSIAITTGDTTATAARVSPSPSSSTLTARLPSPEDAPAPTATPLVVFREHINTHLFGNAPCVDESEQVLACVGSDDRLHVWWRSTGQLLWQQQLDTSAPVRIRLCGSVCKPPLYLVMAAGRTCHVFSIVGP